MRLRTPCALPLALVALLACAGGGTTNAAEPGPAAPAWLPVGRERTGAVGWMSHLGEVRADGSDFKIAGWLRLPDTPKLIAPQPGRSLWRLTNSDLPIPNLDWRHHDLLVHVTLVCGEVNGQPINLARWSIYNEGNQPHEFELLLAVIPLHGDVKAVSLRGDDVLVVNGCVASVCRPGAGGLEASGGERRLRFRASVPPRTAVPFDIVLPRPLDLIAPSELAKVNFEDQLARAMDYWLLRARGFQMELPDERFSEAYRASHAFGLITRKQAVFVNTSRRDTWRLLSRFMERQCAPGVFGWCDDFNPYRMEDHRHGGYEAGRAWAMFARLLHDALFSDAGLDFMTIGNEVPAEWLEHHRPVRILQAPTRFGSFDMTLTADPRRRRLTLVLSGPAMPSRGFLVRLPDGWRATRLTVDGREQPIADELRFGGGARRVEVLYSRAK